MQRQGQLDRAHLEYRAQLVCFLQSVQVGSTHPGATIALGGEQPGGLEFAQCFANRRLAHTEFLGEHEFLEAHARGVAALQYACHQLLTNPVAHARALDDALGQQLAHGGWSVVPAPFTIRTAS